MLLKNIAERLISAALRYGVIGLGLGAFVESLGVPFADLPVQLATGSLISSGRTTFLMALLVSTTGLVLGSAGSYYIGYFGSKIARGPSRKPPSRLMQKFASSLDKHGILIIALAQLYGPGRTWISIPAGAARMNIKSFLIATAIGGVIYCTLAISLSVVLTRVIKDFINLFLPSTHLYFLVGLVAFLLVFLYVYSQATKRR
jgi:membrane protein DedA with SNARE-associated domain